MSARTFVEWQAYYSIEPFGPPAEHWQAGLVVSGMANANRTKKSQKVFRPEDFMPESMMPESLEPDEEQQADAFKARFQAYGEQVKRQEGRV